MAIYLNCLENHTCEKVIFSLLLITVVEIGLMRTAYNTSEAIGSVSVCVEISSAQLARNVSVTLRSVTAGQAVGKPFKSHTESSS